MSDNKEYISKTEPEGSINISEDVISMIAAEALKDVEGIGGIGSSGSISKDITDRFTKKSAIRGIRVAVSEDVVNIDAIVMVKYGYSVNDVARQAQIAVAKSVGDMTGLTVACVNIRVNGIVFDREKQ